MRALTKMFKLLALSLTLAGTLTACHPQSGNTMTDHTASVPPVPMKTVCWGRFAVDLPEDVQFMTQYAHYGSEFVITEATRAQVKEVIVAREKEINAPDNDEHVIKVVPAAKADSAIIVRRLKDYKEGEYEIGYEMDGYFWMAGKQYHLKGGASHNKLDLALSEMRETIALIEPRRDDEIPAIPGFCVEGGFLPGVPKVHYEKALLVANSKSHPDVTFRLTTSTNGDRVDQGLIKRMENSGPFPDVFQPFVHLIKTLRQGQHPVGNIAAEEILARLPEEGFNFHSFQWESTGKSWDILSPGMVVEMDTGDDVKQFGAKVKPSVSDKQAVALFDAVVNSIRLRAAK